MEKDREKELDNLFREGLQHPSGNTNFREDDWDALEAMLDKDKKRGILYFLPIAAIAATLLLALGWVLLRHDSTPQVVKNNPAKQPVSTSINQQKDPERMASSQNNSKLLGTTNEPEMVVHNGEKIEAKNKTTRFANNSRYQNGNRTGVNAGAVNNTGNSAAALPVRQTLPIENTSIFAGNTTLTASVPVIEINSDQTIGSQLPGTQPEIVTAAVKNYKVNKQNNGFRPRSAVTVLASPDINGVNSFSNSMVGTNAGLLFSVEITKKLTISTGALYSKKPYLTNFSDYHSTSAYKFKNDPTSVTADCRVLDIPLNIDYQVYKKARNSFSLGTGISSYLMLRENYHYNYDAGVTTGPSDYDIANKNKHILGVLNLDATYQRQLNSKFSVAVQPYMKVPLTNIGYSQVKLQSAGLAVGVTWNIGSALKP